MAVVPLNLSAKVTISAYSDPECGIMDIVGLPMMVQINPEEITHDHEITTHGDKFEAMGVEGAPGKHGGFKGIELEKIRMNFYLDGTGLVPDPMLPVSPVPFDVGGWIKDFKEMAYKYRDDIHGPYFLRLSWGSLFESVHQSTFKCRLIDLNINYLLFKPTGEPLRARLDCTFKQHLTQTELNALAKRNSPDMSHVRTVQAGDRLPLMCQKIYGSSSHYLQIAKINGLTNIYQLKPGQKLLFPPLEK
ncbi:MAG: peptidoglycan-binding protein [Bacteroidota bacterium]